MFKAIVNTYKTLTEAIEEWWDDNWRKITAIISVPLLLSIGWAIAYWFFY